MCDIPLMRHRLETWWIWAGSGAHPPSVWVGNSRTELDELAADKRLDDGRRVGDVAADVVAGLLAKDGAA